ncbi:MAG: MBL fold metallo-hydrolase [Bdellovibrionales bacterium]|nr:MBL fold metallo-hydrolase [Bdellovibrionales bacterium]
MSLYVLTVPIGPFMQNCRFVYNKQSKEALLFDPGDEPNRLIREAQRLGLKIQAIFLTHGHLDHASAVDAMREYAQCDVYMHEKERPVYEYLKASAAVYGLNLPQPSPVDHYVKDNQEFSFLGTSFRALFTPGHTPGGVCYFFFKEEDPFIVVGDTLFNGSVGRTDLPGGNQNHLFQSIKTKLYTLPEDVVVMSGHGPDTTIGHEKRTNPFVTAYH